MASIALSIIDDLYRIIVKSVYKIQDILAGKIPPEELFGHETITCNDKTVEFILSLITEHMNILRRLEMIFKVSGIKVNHNHKGLKRVSSHNLLALVGHGPESVDARILNYTANGSTPTSIHSSSYPCITMVKETQIDKILKHLNFKYNNHGFIPADMQMEILFGINYLWYHNDLDSKISQFINSPKNTLMIRTSDIKHLLQQIYDYNHPAVATLLGTYNLEYGELLRSSHLKKAPQKNVLIRFPFYHHASAHPSDKETAHYGLAAIEKSPNITKSVKDFYRLYVNPCDMNVHAEIQLGFTDALFEITNNQASLDSSLYFSNDCTFQYIAETINHVPEFMKKNELLCKTFIQAIDKQHMLSWSKIVSNYFPEITYKKLISNDIPAPLKIINQNYQWFIKLQIYTKFVLVSSLINDAIHDIFRRFYRLSSRPFIFFLKAEKTHSDIHNIIDYNTYPEIRDLVNDFMLRTVAKKISGISNTLNFLNDYQILSYTDYSFDLESYDYKFEIKHPKLIKKFNQNNNIAGGIGSDFFKANITLAHASLLNFNFLKADDFRYYGFFKALEQVKQYVTDVYEKMALTINSSSEEDRIVTREIIHEITVTLKRHTKELMNAFAQSKVLTAPKSQNGIKQLISSIFVSMNPEQSVEFQQFNKLNKSLDNEFSTEWLNRTMDTLYEIGFSEECLESLVEIEQILVSLNKIQEIITLKSHKEPVLSVIYSL